MTRDRFRRLVAEALDTIPARFQRHLKNIAIVVEDEPSPALLAEMEIEPPDTLFGLYQGTPLIDRRWDHGNTLPDRIVIFQGPIEDVSETEDDAVTEIGETLIHEVGHYFGLSEEEIEAIEDRYWHRRNGEPGADDGDGPGAGPEEDEL
jgi:predicted Zn-dependent protease with MMP-like domain